MCRVEIVSDYVHILYICIYQLKTNDAPAIRPRHLHPIPHQVCIKITIWTDGLQKSGCIVRLSLRTKYLHKQYGVS